MDLMVNPTITKFAQKVDGEITELKLGANQEDAYAQIYAKGAESGSGKVENNKAATINVSTYTQPVEITPTSGKTSMKKATITLSNIPSPSGGGTAYAWVTGSDVVYTDFEIAPDSIATIGVAKYLDGVNVLEVKDIYTWISQADEYSKITDTQFSILLGRDEFVYTRDSTKDFTLWEISE